MTSAIEKSFIKKCVIDELRNILGECESESEGDEVKPAPTEKKTKSCIKKPTIKKEQVLCIVCDKDITGFTYKQMENHNKSKYHLTNI